MKVGVPAGFSGADACVGLIQQHLVQQVQSSGAQVGRQVLQQMSRSQAELEAACASTMHAVSGLSKRAPRLSWYEYNHMVDELDCTSWQARAESQASKLTEHVGPARQSLPALELGAGNQADA